MALTRDILVANAALSGLTDEQISAITTLSQNDENSVIAKKTGEIYGNLDADILTASGVEKNGTEKHTITQNVCWEILRQKRKALPGWNHRLQH